MIRIVREPLVPKEPNDFGLKLVGRIDEKPRQMTVALARGGWWGRRPTAQTAVLPHGPAGVMRLRSVSSSHHSSVTTCNYFNLSNQVMAHKV